MTPNVTPAGAVADDGPEWMTTRQLADYLQLSWGHTRKIVAEERIRSTTVGVGKRVPRRIHKRWADDYLQARATGAPAPARARRARRGAA